MIYKLPITTVQTAVYQLFKKAIDGYEVFDESTPYQEGEIPPDHFVVIGPISTQPQRAKTDSLLWKVAMTMDGYSNYQGKKKISEILNDVVVLMTSGTYLLTFEGYELQDVIVEQVRVQAEEWSDGKIWQHGSADITLTLEQKEV